MNDIKLNQYLVPEDSPMARHQGQVSSYKFDYENEAGVISTSKIRNASIGSAQIQDASIGSAQVGTLSFNNISGGTATLGGTTNGNGVLVIKDTGGTTKIRGDNTGLEITDGKLTFINSSGGTILDGSGIVSTVNFANDSAFNGAANISTTSTAFTDVASSSLNTLTVSRTTRVLVNMMGYGYNDELITSDGDKQVEVQLYDSFSSGGVDNVEISGVPTTHAYIDGGGTLNIDQTVTSILVARTDILDVLAGTHDYKLQYRAVNGGTAHLSAWSVSYVVLGS